MSRTKVYVDKKELSDIIKREEGLKTFSNHTDLFEHISGFFPDRVTKSVVSARTKEFGIELKTKKGKIGRQGGMTNSQKEAMKKGRNKQFKVANIKELRNNFPPNKEKLLNRVEKGSLRAAVDAMCQECTQYQNQEIKNCTCKSCPLWSFRRNKATV